jgi:hypothetical protein
VVFPVPSRRSCACELQVTRVGELKFPSDRRDPGDGADLGGRLAIPPASCMLFGGFVTISFCNGG